MNSFKFLVSKLLLCSLLLFGEASVALSQLPDLNLIPMPKQVVPKSGVLTLDDSTKIFTANEQLQPLAKILSQSIHRVSDLKILVDNAGNNETDAAGKADFVGIRLSIDPQMKSEEYKISVDQSGQITGSNYRAVSWGVSTFIQLLDTSGPNNNLSVPCVEIVDSPDYEFRSVMIDVARRHHPVQTLKETIELMWLYKINYVHLHLSDNRHTAFTSKSLPKLATPGFAHSIEQWKELVEFADERGVTLIPEIDVPGHSANWVGRMPELFGSTDPETGKHRSVGIVNMANEKGLEALESLIDDLCDVFASSPYIHVGTDEVGAGSLIGLPEYRPYCEKHGLTEALKGQAHELFLHFIQRMNEVVRQRGKQAISWNDFRGASTKNVQIPTNLVQMIWTGSPVTMVEKGYPIINCCWLPLYMVPPQQRAPEDFRIYDWNVRQFQSWHEKQPTILSKDTPIMGAQVCFWEQRYNEVMPILRTRVPAFSERLW
ncbi:MAG: family 20 glycosylhydrolase, partial [Planctomycetota bacterium]